MAKQYFAGIWANKYRQLPNAQRQNVNQLTNQLFQQKTNVYRKLSPTRDRALCDEWLRMRDQAMQKREQPAKRPEVSEACRCQTTSLRELVAA